MKNCLFTRIADRFLLAVGNIVFFPFDLARGKGTAVKLAALSFGWIWAMPCAVIIWFPAMLIALPFMLLGVVWEEME